MALGTLERRGNGLEHGRAWWRQTLPCAVSVRRLEFWVLLSKLALAFHTVHVVALLPIAEVQEYIAPLFTNVHFPSHLRRTVLSTLEFDSLFS